MNWMNKLERKWGRYAIPNISRFLIIAMGIGYVIQYAAPQLMSFLSFSPYYIFRGQVWRLVTWILYPPMEFNLLNIIFLLCVFSMSISLESFLGTFRMNVYIIGGLIINIVGGILFYLIDLGFLYGVFGKANAVQIETEIGMGIGAIVPIGISTYYILLSIFMALAICIPDATVRLYFVLPIKMKWMLYVYFAELLYEIYRYFKYSMIVWWSASPAMAILFGVTLSAQIIFALLNLGLFFYFAKPRPSRKQKKRQKEFRAEFARPRPGSGIYHHKCAICGRTDADDPSLIFRYCSKCAGSYEYCQDHLYTHEHVRNRS